MKKKSKNQSQSKKTSATSTRKAEVKMVPRLPGETQRQYAFFLLYCRANNVSQLAENLSVASRGHDGQVSGKIPQKYPKSTPILKVLGKIPSERTLERWCSKYHWVKRKDRQIGYEIEAWHKEEVERRKKEQRELCKAIDSVALSAIKNDGERR
jgi:hypothetical protein